MAVYDRWHKTEKQPDGSVKTVRSASYGKGMRWQVRWRDEDGDQQKKNFPKKSGKDPEVHAEAYDAQIQHQLDTGTYVAPADANTPFQTFAEDWRKSRPHDVPTAIRVEGEFRKHVYPVIGARPLRELAKRPTISQAWISGLQLAPSSANQVIRDVSAVFSAAMDDGLIPRNPLRARSVTRPQAAERKVQPWALYEVEAIAAALPKRYRVIPYLGVGSGQRQGEMFGLALDEGDPDVDFLRRVIHVRRQVRLIGDKPVFAPLKNGKTHDVPLSDSLAPILAEHIRRVSPVAVTLPWKTLDGKAVTHMLLLTREDGRPMNRTRFNESQWHPALKAAGIKVCRENGCHRLRHTAASAWISEGIDVTAVAAFLGDTVKTVVEYYAHLMPDAEDRARTAMDAFFRSEASAPDVPSEGAR